MTSVHPCQPGFRYDSPAIGPVRWALSAGDVGGAGAGALALPLRWPAVRAGVWIGLGRVGGNFIGYH